MITKMLKYSFLIYHREYNDFLMKLRALGIVHIESLQESVSEKAEEALKKLHKLSEAKNILSQLEKPPIENINLKTADEVLKKLNEQRNKEAQLEKRKKELEIQLEVLRPWGEIPGKRLEQLNAQGVYLHFFECAKSKFDKNWYNQNALYIAHDNGKHIWFFIVNNDAAIPEIQAEYISIPQHNLATLLSEFEKVQLAIGKSETELHRLAAYTDVLSQAQLKLEEEMDWDNALFNTYLHYDGKLQLLQAWVPITESEKLNLLLDNSGVAYTSEKPIVDDNVPILLKNSSFSKLYQPIGDLFSLPTYSELDLTPYFAPFFTLFFGMCLGDVGYGLIILTAVIVLRFTIKKPEIKPLLNLGIFLGGATVLFGLLTGTVFGIALVNVNIPLLNNFKDKFLDVDQLFNLSLIIGITQILFGMILRAINRWRMYGLAYALSPFGWFVAIVGALMYAAHFQKIIALASIAIGLFLIIAFSNPDKGILGRIGTGLWDLYGITGLFGDVLSYIRLFALGLSSSILGLVVNSISLSLLGGVPVLSQLLFIIVLLFGHGLNFGISTLSAFVHPVRLTFVEFYKNAGFIGGGKQYKPFKSKS
ncbi:MAG TPA: V-type ATPase 116kDa subunit family protein [Chitinophagales bacterium]|nr:V-type ATPase 116kDa subunit family protein [Chitinophagales bacterium]